MNDEWAESAATWDEDPAVRRYADAAEASLRDALRRERVSLSDCAVLDFGCGTGLLTEALAPEARSVVGLDVSPAMLERFASKIEAKGWSHVRAEAGPLPKEARFDLIVASSVLGFVPDFGATVAMLASHLNRGGLLVQWDWEAGEDSDHGLSRTAIQTAYDAAGLTTRSLAIGFALASEGYTMAPLMGVAIRT